MFVADGNFKADHVRQKKAQESVWLSEGGGMVPNREEYREFLRTAKERLTVSLRNTARITITNVPGHIFFTINRRHPVKTDSMRL
jgi:hypothetical protein